MRIFNGCGKTVASATTHSQGVTNSAAPAGKEVGNREAGGTVTRAHCEGCLKMANGGGIICQLFVLRRQGSQLWGLNSTAGTGALRKHNCKMER